MLSLNIAFCRIYSTGAYCSVYWLYSPSVVQNAQIQLGGSFGNQVLEASGELDFIIHLSTNTAVYEAIIFKIKPQTKVFIVLFEKDFNRDLIPISLELTFIFIFRTNQPSQILGVFQKQEVDTELNPSPLQPVAFAVTISQLLEHGLRLALLKPYQGQFHLLLL